MSVEDRCMVCDKRTIGTEIVLDAPEGLLGNKAQVEVRFGPFGDGVSVGAWFAPNVP